PAQAEMRLQPGEARTTAVRVTNQGLKAWSAAEGFALSYHWFDPARGTVADGGRTALPRTLGRGEEALLHPVVYAPAVAGCYLLVWDMVQEHTTWLSGQGVATAAVPALVGEADAAACARALPPAVRVGGQPGRRELWPAALDMWRARPWTGVGPDNFRRLYGQFTGRAFWDERVTANNLLLETAAGSGLFGLLALAGTLAAGLGAAARLAGSAAADERSDGRVLAGLLAAMVAHGAVDYLLGFTGQYLLLAFLLGASSAASGAAGAAVVVAERGAA
ncbi:MAG TPA: O-antigen ligase family protein, partial [Vicinamibacteria bacterium]|nr:O-antigen ligase family protein [Vicinamibacteria bacterium]